MSFQHEDTLIPGIADIDSIANTVRCLKNRHAATSKIRKFAISVDDADTAAPQKNNEDAGGIKLRAARIADDLGQLLITTANTMLDFGCGDASITTAVADAYKCKKVYVVDAGEERPTYAPPEYEYYSSAALLANNVVSPKSVDLIMAMMSLHHVREPELTAVLTSLTAAATDDAILVIKEHDVETREDALMVHLEHQLQSKFNDGVLLSAAYGGQYYCRYVGHQYWTDKLAAHGWKLSNWDYVYRAITATRGYWAIYVRV